MEITFTVFSCRICCTNYLQEEEKKTLGLYSLQLFTLNYFGSLQSFLVSRKTSDICFHLFLLVLNCKKPMI